MRGAKFGVRPVTSATKDSARSAEPASTLRVFVIGPIGDRDDPHNSPRRKIYEEAIQVLEQVIGPACSALGLEVIRADQITRTGEIPEQIFRQVRDAHIVVADLTGANPNVMYELGLRHTTGKLTVQIGERERLPFDVSAIRTIMFQRSDGGMVEARRHLISALATGLESGGDPVAATRVWFESGLTSEQQISTAKDEVDGIDELGFLEKLGDSEEGLKSLSQVLSTTTTILEEITRIFVDGTEKTRALEASGGSSSAKIFIANRIAALLEDPDARLRIASWEYAQTVKRIEPGLLYLLDKLKNEPEQLASAPEFPNQLLGLVESAASSIEHTKAFITVMDGMDATRSLRKIAKQISTTLHTIASSSAQVAGWKSAITLIREGNPGSVNN